jgi:hypothetical protein
MTLRPMARHARPTSSATSGSAAAHPHWIRHINVQMISNQISKGRCNWESKHTAVQRQRPTLLPICQVNYGDAWANGITRRAMLDIGRR